MTENVETDSSVKIANYVLPIIVYFPIIVLLVLMMGFFGVKILRIMQTPEGLAGYFNAFFEKFFKIKNVLNKFVKQFWPNATDEPQGDKSWKHIRLDTILMFGGGSFILLMFFLYNSNYLTSAKDKGINGFLYILNPIMNFFAPNKWHGIKRNVQYKQTNTGGKITKNYPLTVGGIALFIGFCIFMSLLVNNHNKNVKTAAPEELASKITGETVKYVYLSIFVSVALAMFAGLLYYAATTDAAPKFLSTLLIVLSTVIILSSILVMFKDRIRDYVKHPIIQVIYNFIFLLPCLFLDLVNFLYFELKRTPKVVYGILIAEIVIIMGVLIMPLFAKAGYIRILGDRDKKNKIAFKIEELKHKNIRLKNKIDIIKNFDPVNSEVEIIKINADLSVTTEKPHPTLVPVDIILTIKENLDEFNIDKTDGEGEIEMIGDLNIRTKNITWNSIKTKDDSIKASFSSDSQKAKCKWNRKDKNKEWNEKYLGYDGIRPLIFKEAPKNLKQLKAFPTVTSYQYEQIEKEIKKRQEIQVSENYDTDTNVFSLMTDKLKQAMEFSKKMYKNGPGHLLSLRMIKSKLTETAWETIIKKNLDNPEKIYELEKLLKAYGYKDDAECESIMDAYQSRKCLEEFEKIKQHIKYNTKQIILFKNTIKETEEEMKNLELMKSDANNVFEKGLILLNEPIYFRQKTYLADHKDFKEIRPETYKYNYSISCWLYVHAQSPNFKNAYNEFTEILNYNDEPIVGYDSKKNRLIIKSKKMKGRPTRNEKNILKTIFIKDNFKLQKWHNVVVNYVGGTIDVFLDGKLVGSEERIVPFKTFNAMTAGEDSGISGGICNVIYYPSYISKSKINSNYEFLKNKNPPII
jgi:hypothetical protein